MSKRSLVAAAILVAACQASRDPLVDETVDESDGDGEVVESPPALAAAAATTTCLNADGPGGKDTYKLITDVLGSGAVEHPDDDHAPPLRHIREVNDAQVGPAFEFLAHRDIDTDRQTNF